jgi:hypothetical protein
MHKYVIPDLLHLDTCLRISEENVENWNFTSNWFRRKLNPNRLCKESEFEDQFLNAWNNYWTDGKLIAH